MSGFTLSYIAQAQMSVMTKADKNALSALFAGDPLTQPDVTKPTEDGRFVSRVGRKFVLWRKTSNGRPEIESIVDSSFVSPEAG